MHLHGAWQHFQGNENVPPQLSMAGDAGAKALAAGALAATATSAMKKSHKKPNASLRQRRGGRRQNASNESASTGTVASSPRLLSSEDDRSEAKGESRSDAEAQQVQAIADDLLRQLR